MCLFQTPLIHAMVASLHMPDYPTPMSISATMCLSSSCSHPPCYLQDRDEISDDVIHHQAPKRQCESHHSVGKYHHSAIWHKPTSYNRIHKSVFRVIKVSIQPHFDFLHARVSGILHYHECYIAPMQGNFMPTWRYCKGCIYAWLRSGISSNF